MLYPNYLKSYQFTRVCSARVLLGLAEGGLFPGIAYYTSLWYPRRMQAQRVALVFSAEPLAGAFGGILAYVVGPYT